MGHPKETGKNGIGCKKRVHPPSCLCAGCCTPAKLGKPFISWNGSRLNRAGKKTVFKPKFTRIKKVSNTGKLANENYRLIRQRVLQVCQRCCICGGIGKEIDHIKGRHGFTGKLQRMVAPRNMQVMCDSNDLTGKLCHKKKTEFKDGHQDFRSDVVKLKMNIYQTSIENNLPAAMNEVPAHRPELKEAIHQANKDHGF